LLANSSPLTAFKTVVFNMLRMLGKLNKACPTFVGIGVGHALACPPLGAVSGSMDIAAGAGAALKAES
jgi:hypothetical protein